MLRFGFLAYVVLSLSLSHFPFSFLSCFCLFIYLRLGVAYCFFIDCDVWFVFRRHVFISIFAGMSAVDVKVLVVVLIDIMLDIVSYFAI